MSPIKTSADVNKPAPGPQHTQPCRKEAAQAQKFAANDTPDWLTQPKAVGDAAATAPALDLSQPGADALTIDRRSISTPFAARDLSGPAGRAFASQPTPNGRLSAERRDICGTRVTKIALSHTVCNSIAHSLHLLARNGVSTHGIIDRDGTIHQLVDLQSKAFIAGPFNESVIGFSFESPVAPRVDQTGCATGEEVLSTVVETMPRKGSDLYTHWRINEAQKGAAGKVANWLSEQSAFSIVPEVADPMWLSEGDEANQFSGVVGLYQIRDMHIAPGFDAMQGVARHMASKRPLSG